VDFDALEEALQTSRVQQILDAVPAHVMAKRATECGSFARAVYHWEQHLRVAEAGRDTELDEFRQLQEVYEQIDEPDAIEGMASRMHILDVSQQVLDHKQSGRWAAALTHYEIAVQKDPEDVGLQIELLECMKSARQYGAYMSRFQMAQGLYANVDFFGRLVDQDC
jgi:serine/threonine-protein kinase ATR